MSWNASFSSRQAFVADKPDTKAEQPNQDTKDQYEAARAAAKSLLDSGVVGDASRDFTINLSGHANPNHAPTPQYANDAISVSIYQKS